MTTSTKTTAEAKEKLREIVNGIKAKVEAEKPVEPTEKKVEAESKPEAKPTPEEKPQEVKTVEAPSKQESAEVAVIEPAEIKNGQLILTPKHLELIRTQIAPSATPDEYDLFVMMARRTRLDPLLKQLYFIKYGNKVSYVTSIDGFRIIAHRTGDFAGVDLPEYSYDANGRLTHASITVYRMVHGQRYGFSAKVKLSEYGTGRDNWVRLQETMLAKVAEAHALRKAFPQDLSGIYTTDEMDQADNYKKPAKQIQRQAPAPRPMTQSQVNVIKTLLVKKGGNKEKLQLLVKKMFGRDTMRGMSYYDTQKVINVLLKLPDKRQEDIVAEPTNEEAMGIFKEGDDGYVDADDLPADLGI